MATQIMDKRVRVIEEIEAPNTRFFIIETEDYTGLNIGEGTTSDNAARLAACWNACLGIPTEMLTTDDPEQQPVVIRALRERCRQLEQQVIALKGTEVTDAHAR